MTRIVAKATRRRGIWTTLQIAFSGVFPPHPVVFPTLQQARFMAYDAIISGARGLFFFGGQFAQVMTPADKALGWNWTYWHSVQRPLLAELSDADHAPALTAPLAKLRITADAPEVALSVRETASFLYLLVVQRSATRTENVRFTGLPAGIREGTVLAHGPSNPARTVTAAAGSFTDPSPFAPHNARAYRFAR